MRSKFGSVRVGGRDTAWIRTWKNFFHFFLFKSQHIPERIRHFLWSWVTLTESCFSDFLQLHQTQDQTEDSKKLLRVLRVTVILGDDLDFDMEQKLWRWLISGKVFFCFFSNVQNYSIRLFECPSGVELKQKTRRATLNFLILFFQRRIISFRASWWKQTRVGLEIRLRRKI